ncbi:MAG: OmpW family outer membrane protein [Fimbriimonas sp.]|nr:OmpW family outer membrane protein [Fimbriimonas sp.]
MKLASIFTLGILGFSAVALADKNDTVQHPWLVRLRALYMVPANNSGAFTAQATDFSANAVNLTNKTFPEVDVTYFFTKNWAAELVLTYPQQHEVSLTGVGKIGTLTHLPPTLSAQYHWDIGKCPVKPYVGVGVNFTMINPTSLSAAGTPLSVTDNSLGLSYGAGLDYKIKENWYLNLDFKHVYIHANVKAGGAILTNVDVNPNLFSVGIGYRF